MRAMARDTDGGFVPLVGQQLRVLFSRSADFVLAKPTGEMKLLVLNVCTIARAANRSNVQTIERLSIFRYLPYNVSRKSTRVFISDIK